MRKCLKMKWLQAVLCFLILLSVASCGQTPPAIPEEVVAPSTVPAMANTPLPVNTNTFTVPTPTNTPEPTPIPGVQVAVLLLPLQTVFPGCYVDVDNDPMTVYYAFNLDKPPFDNVLVRQAFAAAVDREEIAKEVCRLQIPGM